MGTVEECCLLASLQDHIQLPSLYLPEPHAQVLHCPERTGASHTSQQSRQSTETFLQARKMETFPQPMFLLPDDSSLYQVGKTSTGSLDGQPWGQGVGQRRAILCLGNSGSKYLADYLTGNNTKGHVFLAYLTGGASEMAQEVKALVIRPDSLSSIPRFCMAEGENDFFNILVTSTLCALAHACANKCVPVCSLHPHTHIKINNNKIQPNPPKGKLILTGVLELRVFKGKLERASFLERELNKYT